MRIAGLAATILLIGALAFAQRFGEIQHGDDGPRPTFPTASEFHFIRLEYTDLPEYHRRWGFASRGAQAEGWWVVDWPDADDHFSLGVQRLTRIDTGDPRHVRLDDPKLFDYPWIYATQAGWWDLSNSEVAHLREYLLRGGFLVTDDFWGAEQWEVFRGTMNRVFPNKPITDIAESDAVMHVLYDISIRTAPSSRALAICGEARTDASQSSNLPARHRRGVRSTTIGTAWWSRRTTTPTSGTPGNMPTRRSIPKP